MTRAWDGTWPERLDHQLAGVQPLFDAIRSGRMINICGSHFQVSACRLSNPVGGCVQADLTLLYVGRDMKAMG